ncbi:hypothetical protein A7D23_06135 [Dehalobacter sp. TeCB1]|nr:hypothetical protein A7D23_06135 [Dehalobacter sp. TeCB1]
MKKRVIRLTRRYKTNNPFRIAELKNILILFEPLGNTLGYHNSYKRSKFIHINENLEEIERQMVCAHELGHAILHPKANTPFLRANTYFSTDRIEREANEFAAELLLPDYLFHENHDKTINEIAASYDIPRELIAFKRL